MVGELTPVNLLISVTDKFLASFKCLTFWIKVLYYNLETKTAKKALKKVWKNLEAKKEVLAGLDGMNKGELFPRNQKNFKGFKTLKELKFTKTRMLVRPGINGSPDQVVAIFMRPDMDHIASIFKDKYK